MPQRNDQDWLDELCGDRGEAQQRLAHEDLSRYLYVVAYNYLRMRQGQANPAVLANFAPQELAALAQDFVQDTLEKLARDDYALLDQFGRRGRFTAWAAQIVRRQAAQELRRPYWTRRKSVPQVEGVEGETAEWLPSFEFALSSGDAPPENVAMRQEVAGVLQACLKRLPERWALAFWGCVAEERRAEFVANALGTTTTAVYLLVYRAKRQLEKCLGEEGLDRDILEIFEE